MIMHPGGPSWHDFTEAWDLFREPIYAAAISGVVLGFLSVYVVVKRMVFVSAAVTQAAGLGIAMVFYLHIHTLNLGLFEVGHIDFDPIYGAVAMALAASAILVANPERLGLSREALLGMMFVFSGGAAVAIGARITQEAHDIQAILFGTGVMVMPEDFARLWKVALVVMGLQLWWFRGLTFASFDPVAARVQGLPVRLLDLTLLLSIGVMVGVTAQALGAMPTFALSTLPGAAAVVLTRGRLGVTYVLAALFGGIAGVGGYLFAFFQDLPVGGSQTLVAVFILVLALAARAVGRVIRSVAAPAAT
jgi:zinc transport system permease protein